MLSVAMVVVLIIGINFVFRQATDAVGAGQYINAASSDSQSSQTLLFDDFRNIVKDPPCFIIASQIVPQFLNATDAQTATALPNQSVPLQPLVMVTDNQGTMQYINEGIYGSRSHRVDLLRFFARGYYARHTGPLTGQLIGTDTAADAFITLGHVLLPANGSADGATLDPVSGRYFIGPTYDAMTALQRVGAYASDWVLGRSVMLLKDPSDNNIPAASAPYYSFNSTSTIQPYSKMTDNLTPLGYNSPDSANTSPIESSRYDLAGVTVEQFRRAIANEILNWRNANPPYSGNDLWWNPLIYTVAFTQTSGSAPNYFVRTPVLPNPAGPPYTVPYYAYSATGPSSGLTSDQYLVRQLANPSIQQPLTSQAISQMSPYLLQHCSQFIVEYAGDYMQQDNNPAHTASSGSTTQYGDMTGIGPDGQIDYYLDANNNKHIRWYGMPRSSTGVSHASSLKSASDATKKSWVLIRGYDSTNNNIDSTPDKTSTLGLLNYFTDVIPLRDYYSMYFATNAPSSTNVASPAPPNIVSANGYYLPPWEVDVNFDSARDYGLTFNATGANIGKAAGPPGPIGIAFGDPANPSRYACAWFNDMPAMIRILIKVDDPNNQVKDGPWYEYVFRLK